MKTLSPLLVTQLNIQGHTSTHPPGRVEPRHERRQIPHFADSVELVSGDNGNYAIAKIHRAEAEHLYQTKRAIIPNGYHRQRNIAKLFVIDHHPRFEEPRHTNSSKTTFVSRFVVTPGSASPRFASGRSIMGIVIQHKPISSQVSDLYGRLTKR